MIDVYDCAQWKSTFGPPPPVNSPTTPSIKLLFCYDGIPANNYVGSESLVPGEFIVLSLPPWQRYKENNILISVLFQDGLSAKAQKKFFDKIIEVDFKPLFTEGVQDKWGDNIRVEIFGHTLDLKGREKFLNQVSVQSYVGCSHCRAVFPKGNGGPCFGIARKYLPDNHPLRAERFGLCQYAAAEVSGITIFTVIREHDPISLLNALFSRACVPTPTPTHKYLSARAHTHTRTHTYVHNTHTHIHAHAHIHTPSWPNLYTHTV